MSGMTAQELVAAVNTQFVTGNGWPEDATASYDPATGIITMPNLGLAGEGEVTIKVPVEVEKYTITIEDSKGGTIEAKAGDQTITSSGEIAVNTEITLTATPAEGYELTELKYNETPIDITGETYQFTMPASDVTVTATFKAKTYTITINTPTGGTIEAKAGEQMTVLLAILAALELPLIGLAALVWLGRWKESD